MERLDDLLTSGLHIIQSDEVFSFSLDAVLLAHFCTVPGARGSIIDLCSGNGIVPLLLSTRTQAFIRAVEIQARLANMAMRSVEHNHLQHQIAMTEGDLRTADTWSDIGTYDLVTVNPPYLALDGGDVSDNRYIAGARHEIDCTLRDVAMAASILLRSGGKLAMVHRPHRLAEIIVELAEQQLQVKRLRFVHPRIHAEANMVLIEASKGGKPNLRLLPPLIVHDTDGYSAEVHGWLYGTKKGM